MSEAAQSKTALNGVGVGVVLAIVISWSVNHSILWAILHGILNWFYVIYWCVWGDAPWEK